jgi:hypothetical protein
MHDNAVRTARQYHLHPSVQGYLRTKLGRNAHSLLVPLSLLRLFRLGGCNFCDHVGIVISFAALQSRGRKLSGANFD